MNEYKTTPNTLNPLSGEFETQDEAASQNKLYVDVGQAAIMRPNGKITQLATDKVVGCLAIIAKNPQDGAMGLIHVMANLDNSDLSEEWDDLIHPVMSSLAPDGQQIEVNIFGGVYADENQVAGQHFIDRLTQKLGDIPNVDILASHIGSTPHPTAVVLDVENAGIAAGTDMVSSYEEAIQQITTEHAYLIDLSVFPKADVEPLHFGLVHDDAMPHVTHTDLEGPKNI